MSQFGVVRANLGRRKLRNAVTATGVAIAIASLFSLISFQRGYQRGLRDELDRLGAHLLIVPKGCPYDAASIALHGASWPCYLKADYVETVRHVPHVAHGAPVFMSAMYDAASGAQTVYCGVEPDILQVKRSWRVDGQFPKAGEILIGNDRAKKAGWQTGNEVELPGLEGRRARISGVLAETQGADDLFIFMPLQDAQTAFKRPAQLTHMLVRLDDPDNMEGVVGALQSCGAGLDMNVVPLAHLFQTIQSLVQSTRVLLGSIAFVALLCAGAGLSNTIFMAISERTREIGVMRAIGASTGDVFRLILMETIVLCVIGAFLGVALAFAGSGIAEAWLRSQLPFVPRGSVMRPDIPVALFSLVVALVLGAIAGVFPAWRASKLAPSLAMRSTGAA